MLVGVAAIALLASGCGSARSANMADPGSADPSGEHSHHAGMSMPNRKANKGASEAARMICTGEIGQAVQRTFALSQRPSRTASWTPSSVEYSCVYRLSGGNLRLSVDDARNDDTGRAHFDKLRASLPNARAIRGMENFGLPAFATPDGNVVIIKDGKTLRVDATRLPRPALPPGYSAEQAAYSIASAVIACWTE